MSNRMVRKGLALAVAAVTVAAIAGTALAGGTAGDPLALLLKPSDAPGSARHASQRMPAHAVSAVAASAVKDPMRLILTRADVAGAKQTVQQAPIDTGGVRGKFAGYSYYFMRGQQEGLQVAGGVYAVESAAQARKVFASLQRQPGGTSPGTKVQLPRYGDQQIAWHKASASYAKALVRKNTVVWQVEIVGTGSFAPVDELAELKKYALKQQRRVGSG